MARGTVRQRSKVKKDSWTVQIYLGVNPTTGEKRYHSETIKGTMTQAQCRLTELLHQLDTSTYSGPTHLTVAEYLWQWMRDYAEMHVSQRTLEGYRANLERYLLPKIGKIRLERLSASQVQEMESALLRNGRKNGGPLSPRTRKWSQHSSGTVERTEVHFRLEPCSKSILSKALKDAVKLGLISRNVAEKIKPPRTTQYEVRTLTWNQISTFWTKLAIRSTRPCSCWIYRRGFGARNYWGFMAGR